MKKIKYEIKEDILIKDFIKNNISKKFYRYIKRNGYKLYRNDKEVLNYELVHNNDILTIEYKDSITTDNNLYEMDLDILYETDYLMVIYKPKGLKTIPTGYNDFKSLYNGILYYYKKNNIEKTIHFINRLDKDTEGLLLVAKDKLMANMLSKDLKNIDRYYYAYVEGILKNKKGIINSPIKKSDNGIKREVSFLGKEAITEYEVLKELDGNSILNIHLETGRCHQIRVHLSSIGHPIIGDNLYGLGNDLHLASYRIKFKDPVNNKMIDIIKNPGWW